MERVKITCNLGHLLRLAKKMNKGTQTERLKARKKHDDYKKTCLEANEVRTHLQW